MSTDIREQTAPRTSVANRLTEPTDQYLRTFSWNKVRYRSDRPMAELIETLQKVRWLFEATKLEATIY